MSASDKAARIRLFKFNTPQMRAFHMSWFAFFLCFFAWFGIAPMMVVIRDEMGLTRDQIGWLVISSVSTTILARLLVGCLCDRIGPRLAYTWLLMLGAVPVIGVGLAHDFQTLLVFRLMIGCIGASFVITQYHTSVMFASNCVGTANATTAGWGNLGGGVTQMMMPLLFALFTGVVGVSSFWGWRLSMIVAGVVCFMTGIAYYLMTQDCPEGNYKDLRASGRMAKSEKAGGTLLEVLRDPRVCSLFAIYGVCFGVELTINNIAALYFVDYFDYFQGMSTAKAIGIAGAIAGMFGLMNLFARTTGGYLGDRFGVRWGLKGRVTWLFAVLFCEGLALMLFSQMSILVLAVPALIVFGMLVQMSSGATFSVVPFINKRAMAAGFLFKSSIPWPTAFLILGATVTCCSFLAFTIRFSESVEHEAREEMFTTLGLEPVPATVRVAS
jgi:NNP family nitrate/nitrite transporter-like MFS transporter